MFFNEKIAKVLSRRGQRTYGFWDEADGPLHRPRLAKLDEIHCLCHAERLIVLMCAAPMYDIEEVGLLQSPTFSV